MRQWGAYAAGSLLAGLTTGATLIGYVVTGHDALAVGVLGGVAVTGGWFLRYVHAVLESAHRPSLTQPPSDEAGDQRDADENSVWWEPEGTGSVTERTRDDRS